MYHLFSFGYFVMRVRAVVRACMRREFCERVNRGMVE